jgi:hypothetical protein
MCVNDLSRSTKTKGRCRYLGCKFQLISYLISPGIFDLSYIIQSRTIPIRDPSISYKKMMENSLSLFVLLFFLGILGFAPQSLYLLFVFLMQLILRPPAILTEDHSCPTECD